MSITEIHPETLAPPVAQSEIGVMGIYADWQGMTFPEIGPVSMEMIRDMFRKDSQARGLLSLVTKPIMSSLSQVSITPTEGDAGEAELVKDLFLGTTSVGGPVTPIAQVLREMCLALRDGFSVHEIVWKIITEGKHKGKLGLHKLARRPAETIQWVVNKNGDPVKARQRSHNMGQTVDVEIPIEKLLHFVVGSEENSIYGRSYFETAYYSYDKKSKMLQLTHLAGQAHVVPPRVVTYNASATDPERNRVVTAAANLGMNLVIAVPQGIEVEALQTSSNNFPWLDLVNYHDGQMSKSVLAMFFDKDQQSSSLVDMGGKDPGTSMFVLAIESLMNDMQVKINEIVEVMVRSNFAKPAIPLFEFHELTDEQREALEALFTKLATAQSLNASPEFMAALEERQSDRYSFDIDYDKIKADAEKKKQVEQAMAEAALKTAESPPQPVAAPSPSQPGNPAPHGQEGQAREAQRGRV